MPQRLTSPALRVKKAFQSDSLLSVHGTGISMFWIWVRELGRYSDQVQPKYVHLGWYLAETTLLYLLPGPKVEQNTLLEALKIC